jgi:hypothetical protein
MIATQDHSIALITILSYSYSAARESFLRLESHLSLLINRYKDASRLTSFLEPKHYLLTLLEYLESMQTKQLLCFVSIKIDYCS